jgi:hypothetical protein
VFPKHADGKSESAESKNHSVKKLSAGEEAAPTGELLAWPTGKKAASWRKSYPKELPTELNISLKSPSLQKRYMLIEANGSIQSILDWATKSQLNSGQHRAFEIFVGTLIFTFFGKT